MRLENILENEMKKIKVLIVAGDMHIGGIENQLMHLLRNADPEKFQIDFTSTMPDAYYRSEIESLGGGFILIPEMNWKKPWVYCRALYKVMRAGGYDVVHSHELFHSGIVLWLAAKAGISARFVHAHNWSDGSGRGEKRSFVRSVYNTVMQKLILRHSTAQLACSTLAGKFLYGENIPEKSSYHLVYNSVDTAKFLDHYDDRESGEFTDDGWTNILQVGRVTRVKNQLFLTEIAGEFKKRGKKIRILCAGNGDADYTDDVCTAIRAQGLEAHMQMLGVRGDIDVLMRKAAAFVLPSRYEGMPLVLIEAQASGLSCVVADTFSHEVDFELGKIQWLQLEDGAARWADALEKAVLSGRAPKEDIVRVVEEKRFDSRLFAETLCKLYEESSR